MESPDHEELKLRARAFLGSLGCRVSACEVRCPIARFRVDVAGYLDRPPPTGPAAAAPAGRTSCDPRTIVIECKVSRGDFFRDGLDTEGLLAERAELERLRRGIEERRVKLHEPHLRRSEGALFPDLEEWDFAQSRLPGYRAVLARISGIEEKLHGQTKFFTIARYRLADRLYLAAPRGMIRARELPPGWGLLEPAVPAAGRPRSLHIVVEAPPHATRPERRVRLLRNIAVAACRAAGREERAAALNGAA